MLRRLFLIALVAATGLFLAGSIALAAPAQDIGHDPDGQIEAALEGAAHDAGHGGEEHAVQSPLSVRTDLGVWTLVVFVLLLAILWKFAWGPIAEGLDKREHSIADEIAAAHKSNEDAKALLGEYERKLANAQLEVRGILDEARRDAEHTQQEILAKARSEAQAFRDRSMRDIETATSQALTELAQKSADLAVELAGKIVQAQLRPADHARLISDAMDRFPKAAQKN